MKRIYCWTLGAVLLIGIVGCSTLSGSVGLRVNAAGRQVIDAKLTVKSEHIKNAPADSTRK